MSKPRFVQFDQIDKNFRLGTGALPVVLVVLAVLSLIGGLVTVGGFVTGVVSCALLLAVSAIVSSIRNIEAYIIYIARVKQYEMNGSSTVSSSDSAAKSYLD